MTTDDRHQGEGDDRAEIEDLAAGQAAAPHGEVAVATPVRPAAAPPQRQSRPRFGDGSIISCDNLVRIYKVADLEVVALQGLDLLIDAGEIVAIIGASGSGKSTLLNILGGLDSPSAGRAVVAGYDLGLIGRRDRTRYRRRVVGIVWQQTMRNLFPYLTAQENVELPLTLDGARESTQAGARTARYGRPRRSCRSSSGTPVGWRAAARRDRGRAREPARRAPRRRADR